MSKLKVGDVVQVLNTEGFYDGCDYTESEESDVVKGFLYSIGVVDDIITDGSIPILVEIDREGYGGSSRWWFNEDNLNKIGVL